MVIDRRTLLEQLQDKLLEHLEATSVAEATEENEHAYWAGARDACALSKELRAVTAELESLAPVKESSVDDLTKRRAARRAEAAS
jgi:hypothetical protein